MTDDALDPRDELASAHLDGETTPDEAQAIASDPQLSARVAALAATRDAVRTADGPVDETRREIAIAAALAAFDETGAEVTPIVGRRRPSAARWLPLVGVAAAVLAVALAIPVLTRDDDTPDEDLAQGLTTTLAPPAVAEDAFRAAEPNGSSRATEDETRTLAIVETADFGPQADVDALTAAVRARLVAGSPTTLSGSPPPMPSPEAETCLAPLRQAAVDQGSATFLQVTAVVDGQAVTGTVTQRPDGTQVLDVVAVDGCAPIASVQL
ncbi:MAG TPA: hypothetical protein VJ804_12960 [Acidimicrobiales bacterium]|nr:hypothetical protein [Acidimicrobiales bacterium]